MHLIYIDDSYERPYQIYSAIAVPAASWNTCFEAIKAWRRGLKQSDGILVTREFHATEFCGGRGKLGDRVVGKYRRSRIFREAMRLTNGLPGVRVFSVCHTQNRTWALERLITRINKTLGEWDSHAVLMFDEGKEQEITKLLRRMGVYNPVPVYVGSGVTEVRNLKLARILDDPIFKKSEHSYFVQLADFAAYAVLRREKRLASKDAYGYHECYELMPDAIVREASIRDPLGIIR